MRFKKAVYIAIGCLSVGLGAVVPMLPAFPFLMLATFCFAKSSRKLHNWFMNTKLYQDNLVDYAAGNGMTITAKWRVMLTAMTLMAFGFVMMLRKALYIPCVILGCVWVFHILCFKTKKEEGKTEKTSPAA